jgi:hypothetical protein
MSSKAKIRIGFKQNYRIIMNLKNDNDSMVKIKFFPTRERKDNQKPRINKKLFNKHIV